MRKIFVIALLAILGLGSLSVIPNLASADLPLPDKTWGHMNGIINQTGDNPAFGNININVFRANVSGEIKEWARVFAMWTNKSIQLEDPSMNLKPIELGGNFTVHYYSARLTNSTEISFDKPGYDLYIAGNWTVINVTRTITVNKFGDSNFWGFSRNVTTTCELVVIDAHGVLTVENTTTTLRRPLELQIDGVETLRGFVVGRVVRHIEVKLFEWTVMAKSTSTTS
jgi:hypothetical protein